MSKKLSGKALATFEAERDVLANYVYKGCLFISQRHQWIDFRCAACRNVTG